jgi:hypothetical protein
LDRWKLLVRGEGGPAGPPGVAEVVADPNPTEAQPVDVASVKLTIEATTATVVDDDDGGGDDEEL